MSPSSCTEQTPAAWSVPLRVAFRFAFLYFPAFVAVIVLKAGGSSTDTAAIWRALGVILVGSGCLTLVWSVVDRRRPSYPRLYSVLDGFLRVVVVAAMLFYGLDKVFAAQFPALSPHQLSAPLGQLAPIELLWAFMGYSPAYSVFGGLMETVGGVLLAFRRTRTLGALILLGAMANVVALNFSYDVCVKVLSAHLLLMDMVLLVPDLPRIGRFFFGAQSAPPRTRVGLWLGRVGKALLVFFLVTHSLGYLRRSQANAHTPAAAGTYDVVTFVRDGKPVDSTFPGRWRSVELDRNLFIYDSADGDRQGFPLLQKREAADRATLIVTPDDPAAPKNVLTYALSSAGVATLEGQWDAHHIQVTLRSLAGVTYPLTSHGFHWVKEGFN